MSLPACKSTRCGAKARNAMFSCAIALALAGAALQARQYLPSFDLLIPPRCNY